MNRFHSDAAESVSILTGCQPRRLTGRKGWRLRTRVGPLMPMIALAETFRHSGRYLILTRQNPKA